LKKLLNSGIWERNQQITREAMYVRL